MTEARTDNFGNIVANPLTDLVDVAGEKDFTPERLRLFRNGSRIYLQYGDDSHYTETDSGHQLEPDSGDTMTMRSAERISYPVGFDLIPSMSWGVNQAPQSGDVVMGGYGNPDVANFDPATETYSGSNADGYFWVITEDTGLDEILLIGVRDGTIFDTERSALTNPADAWLRFAQWLNWYDVGPCRFFETYTNVANDRTDPQTNQILSSVANDDGKGPRVGSHRITVAIHQDAANSGLTVDMGSIGVSVPGRFDYIFKDKTHSETYTVTNSTDGEYEVVGAIRTDPTRPLTKARVIDVSILTTPSTSTSAEILLVSVDPDSTNLTDGDFSTPNEHTPRNSVIETVVDNGATGPDFADGGTDSTGATTAGVVTNPGGYQVGRAVISSQGTGNRESQRSSSGIKVRELYDTDWTLVLIDSDEAGDHKLDYLTAQNN